MIKALTRKSNVVSFVIETILWVGVLLCGMVSLSAGLNENVDFAAQAHLEIGLGLVFYSLIYVKRVITHRGERIIAVLESVSALFCLAAAILCFCSWGKPILLSVSGTVFFVTLALRRIPRLLENHGPRNIVVSAMITIICAMLIWALWDNPSKPQQQMFLDLLVLSLTLIGIGFAFVMVVAFSRIRLGLLLKIIRRTFVAEVIFGLLTLILVFSFIFNFLEPTMFKSYGDAVWYSFVLVTTIGFGDMYPTTIITRVLSVILGIYGIIVVAVITSVVVNFYQETTKEDRPEESRIVNLEEKVSGLLEGSGKKKEKKQDKEEPKPEETKVEEKKE